MVLVDTTIWIDLLRNRTTRQTAILARLLELGEAAVTPVIVQEILQGSRDEAAFQKLRAHFLAMPALGVSAPLMLADAAARLYARARWSGVTPRSPHDCLIAAVAIAENVWLLSADADFTPLAAIEPKLRLVL